MFFDSNFIGPHSIIFWYSLMHSAECLEPEAISDAHIYKERTPLRCTDYFPLEDAWIVPYFPILRQCNNFISLLFRWRHETLYLCSKIHVLCSKMSISCAMSGSVCRKAWLQGGSPIFFQMSSIVSWNALREFELTAKNGYFI